jgi:aminoglycoside phosphotransferase family enzyme
MDSSFYLLSQKTKPVWHWSRNVVQAIYHALPANIRNAIAFILAYEYRYIDEDNWLTGTLKSIVNFVIAYFPLFYILRFFQRYFSDSPYYPFKYEILQTTTRVIFTRSKRSGRQICLKFWRRTEDEVCDERLIVRNDEYLIEGLEFNRKFAPGVYLGIATVIVSDDNKHIQRGPLIKHPFKEQLLNGERYALVMRTLKRSQRLDSQLKHKKVDVGFLAHQVAQMHRQLEQTFSSDIYGMPDRNAAKLSLNNELFIDAMIELFSSKYKNYLWIGACLKEAGNIFSSRFERRCSEGHIKHCHGDLKVTNLWVRSLPVPFCRSKFLALDCIDFKPEFCFIDTLSDVAMLVVDLERLYPRETELTKRFLHTYLGNMQENLKFVEPLLEYYLTEKAIVCSYVSILFDDQQDDQEHELGKKYLQIACSHAQRLRKLVEDAKCIQAKELVYSN